MRSHCAKVKLKLADEEYFERELVRHYFIFAANSRLRCGELKQLSWYNVDTFRQDETIYTNEIDKQIAVLQKKQEDAIKANKKKAIVDVKKLTLGFKLTKGDLRRIAMKQLVGAEWDAKMM